MTLIVGPSGASISSDPREQDLEDAAARLRNDLARSIYGAGPRGTILDERGRPLNRTAPRLSGLAAWLPSGPPSEEFLAYWGPRKHLDGCDMHPRHEGRCSTDPLLEEA